CPKTGNISSFLTKIEMGFKGVIEKYSIRFVVVQRGIKRNGFVYRIGILAKGIGICYPIFKTFPFKIVFGWFIAQAIITFAFLSGFRHFNNVATMMVTFFPMES